MEESRDLPPYLRRPSREMTEAARELRQRETPAEDLLWGQLRGRRLHGRKFRRQHPVGHFVLDFFCDDARLVVEIDGSIHQDPDQLERDCARQETLELLGLTVLRFTNEDVLFSMEATLARIEAHLVRNTFEGRD